MSYRVVGHPAAKPRPTVVTAGMVLLFVIAALILARGALGVITVIGHGDEIASQFVQGVPIGSAVNGLSAIISSVVYVVLAAGAVATGVLVGKGRNPARVVAWSLSGVLALCCGCQSIASLFSGAIESAGLQGGNTGIEQALSGIP